MLKEKLMDKIYPWYPQRETDSIVDMLEFEYRNYPERVAFSYRDSERQIVDVTVREFYEEAWGLAEEIAARYRGEDNHIALIGENSYNWLLGFFGIILSGNVAVPIDKDLSMGEVRKLLKISETKIAFYSDKYCGEVANISKLRVLRMEELDVLARKRSREARKFVQRAEKLAPERGELVAGEKKLARATKKHTDTLSKHKVNKNKCAVIFFTSGTTGPNKGVMLSQKNIAADCYFASQNFKPEEGSTTVAFLPWHHSFGLVTAVLMPFYYHLPIFINSSLKNIMQDFHDYHPQTIFAVPQVVELFYRQIWRTAKNNGQDRKLKMGIRFANQLKLTGIDTRQRLFRQLREQFGGELSIIICGGAYLDRRHVKWFRNIGIEVLVGYGITECSPVLAVNRNKYAKDGSVGVPVHGCEVAIIDDEVCARGDNVMLGYYKDKKATREVIKNGWFRTGDLGYIDHNGFLFLTGRKKNLIILNNGENISPERIEEFFLHDRAVCECVAYASGNRIIVSIYPEEEYLGDDEYFDNLMYNYNSTVPKNHQVALVRLRTEEFPKNNNRKILRAEVEKEENEG